MTTTVYVRLLDEGTDVWRPVEADQDGDLFKLIGPMPDDEHWEFIPGTIVGARAIPLGIPKSTLCRAHRQARLQIRLSASNRALT
jgi:hypothetical protein